MVEYQGKKVTVRTKVKHALSDVVINWVDQVAQESRGCYIGLESDDSKRTRRV
jgi:hypothetical protein